VQVIDCRVAVKKEEGAEGGEGDYMAENLVSDFGDGSSTSNFVQKAREFGMLVARTGNGK
jgi:hypothetical protein